ncbi:MAG: ribosomal protein S18-alanine N-acetyltransferase [Lachnospiraceae bacterium]|jgi:ribosomal-protein-alanine N-acetyltransferase|uniref:ribosomal protein S18-alanine N-acetyltransferase n=1 Tax=Clostridium sp. (strain SY8519) TaxID=1042156 RepID=UPI0002171F8D|nr:ribosomal protein S18-alanine N-acetyltransferase [Clostridium sp. SY8519]MCI1655268.1 ribosomal protein S18-alanine N-acetyltransferase [Lachnospiraceae bacterium]MCI1657563.1 ribosomal protein S18-alanine N-acetyltransferase [Lachnospiraceae bacterium]MCI2196023.1 ribosomal protein S18-alanine N-acetyltransferase [Lachnospiraceae bacterium]BAK46167.1 hypothetical protein CXIVA_02000 [Clostridium sp. SY8519]
MQERNNTNVSAEPEVILRGMRESDAAQAAELEAACFSMPWSEQGFLEGMRSENTIFCAAEAEGRLAGYCGLYTAADEGEITNVAVREDFRRRGIGRMLIREIQKQAARRGIRSIYLEVRESNTAAQAVYEKTGFSVCGCRKNFYRNPREDARVMCCCLEELEC